MEDLPASRLADPVLPLTDDVGEVARAVVLLEIDHDEIALARVAKHRDSSEAHLDPFLAFVDAVLVRAPRGEVLAAWKICFIISTFCSRFVAYMLPT